jgi:hypothetical protein
MYYWIIFAFLVLFSFEWIKQHQLIILGLIAFVLVFVVIVSEQQLKSYRETGTNTSRIKQLKEIVKPLLTPQEFNDLKLYDMRDNFEGKGVAFTLKKSSIYICTLKKDTKEPEDLEVLTYVLIHELTHQLCKRCVQHDAAFHIEFKKMLAKADSLGITYKIKKKICGKCLL